MRREFEPDSRRRNEAVLAEIRASFDNAEAGSKMQAAAARLLPQAAFAVCGRKMDSIDSSKSPDPRSVAPRSLPLRLQRLRQIGLQGRILLALMVVMVLALSATCWAWAKETSYSLDDILGEQATQIAYTLGLASAPALANADQDSLQAIALGLLKHSDIVFVAFHNSAGKALLGLEADGMPLSDAQSVTRPDPEMLMQVMHGNSARWGNYLQVCSPVFSAGNATSDAPVLVGYVTVGVSTHRQESQIHRANSMAVGVGCAMALFAVPLAYLLVRRIFTPIRELVSATHQIAGGDLDVRVDTQRTDITGELARSFNEMAITVKSQRDRLQEANGRLEQSNGELEARVLQRTSELESANSRLSREIAEKEDFLRAVSHDLNAPLRNISGMATMLLMNYREKLEQDIVHRLERICKNVEVETGLISELLELSRIKTRPQKSEFVEIGPLIMELEGILENDLKGKSIALAVDTPMPVLNGDRTRFRQIFQNLIDNAIKYMGDSQTREIHIGCRIDPHQAEFYVRDTGIGIHPDDLEKVFFIFRRGRNTGSVGGKGVGLASVKSIIETYSGQITVESQLGQGCTFRFTIDGEYVAQCSQLQPHAPGSRHLVGGIHE
jgi:signal transduction histidine kinase